MCPMQRRRHVVSIAGESARYISSIGEVLRFDFKRHFATGHTTVSTCTSASRCRRLGEVPWPEECLFVSDPGLKGRDRSIGVRDLAQALELIPRWEHFDHGADIGVRGMGTTEAESFEQAAIALTAVITDPARVIPKRQIGIECTAADGEALLVEWLNALVYEMAVQRMIFCRFEVHLEGHHIRGSAWGEEIDIARHEPAVEVKGATYTSLSVGQNPKGTWVAQCVVDV